MPTENITTYILPLVERDITDADVNAAAERLASDAKLSANARVRSGGIKLQRWWNVVSGVLLILFFVLYSFYLTIPALIVAGVMAVFLGYVGVKVLMQKAALNKTETEISPHRCADAFLRRALGMPAAGRDISRFFDIEAATAFGTELKKTIAALGLDPMAIALKTACDITRLEHTSPVAARIPICAILTFADTRVILEYHATFALPSTGDCILVDMMPRILIPIKTEKPYRNEGTEYSACPCCGARISESFIAVNTVCPACGFAKKG